MEPFPSRPPSDVCTKASWAEKGSFEFSWQAQRPSGLRAGGAGVVAASIVQARVGTGQAVRTAPTARRENRSAWEAVPVLGGGWREHIYFFPF